MQYKGPNSLFFIIIIINRPLLQSLCHISQNIFENLSETYLQ